MTTPNQTKARAQQVPARHRDDAHPARQQRAARARAVDGVRAAAAAGERRRLVPRVQQGLGVVWHAGE